MDDQAFANACNAADQAGKRLYGDDWDSAKAALAKSGGVAPADLARVVSADPNDAAEVLFRAGADRMSDTDYYAMRSRQKAESRGRPWSQR